MPFEREQGTVSTVLEKVSRSLFGDLLNLRCLWSTQDLKLNHQFWLALGVGLELELRLGLGLGMEPGAWGWGWTGAQREPPLKNQPALISGFPT